MPLKALGVIKLFVNVLDPLGNGGTNGNAGLQKPEMAEIQNSDEMIDNFGHICRQCDPKCLQMSNLAGIPHSRIPGFLQDFCQDILSRGQTRKR